jgi:hypothetical protein
MQPSLLTRLVLIGAAAAGHAPLSAHTTAQVTIGVGMALPGLSLGINLTVYPELVQVPGYPLYYAPELDSNYFFYDGMYWIFEEDGWYTSSWYNGPWFFVDQEEVPVFILRVPVGYYRRPPLFFGGWQRNAPPRWGEHWGRSWEQRRHGWDRWDRRAIPVAAPLPTYQRNHAGDQYPGAEQQRDLHRQNYRYQPREVVVRERGQQPVAAPEERGRLWEPTRGKPREAPSQPRRPSPAEPQPDRGRSEDRVPTSPPAAQGSERQPPRSQAPSSSGKEPRDRKDSKEPRPGQGRGQERDRENREERPKQERWP